MTKPDSSTQRKKAANGSGSVWLRPDGRWGISWIERDEIGNKRRRATTAKTEHEARLILRAGQGIAPGDWGYGHLKELDNDSDTNKVYFIQLASGGPIKIGTAKNLRTRILALQSGCPYPLRVLHTIDNAGWRVEHRLHKRFAKLRLHGEWFRDAPELLQFIADLRA